MSLFFQDSDDDETYQLPQKRRKLDADTNFTDSESDNDDWETIPLTFEQKNSFNVTITKESEEEIARKQKIKDRLKEKQRKMALHSMSMVVYMLHAKHRNSMLSNKKVMKALKKLLPLLLKSTHLKKFNQLRLLPAADPKESEVLLIYILQYLIKWFRVNFKINSNGIRVLGYTPSLDSSDEYFPKKAPPIASIEDLIKVIKRFSHNRDTAAQLFTAVLRSLGFEARMVFSLPLLPVNSKQLQPKADYYKLEHNKDYDLLYPYFWTELVNPLDPSEIIILESMCFHHEVKRLTRLPRYNAKTSLGYTPHFYPARDQFNSMNMEYVLAFNNKGLVIDVTSRYMKNVAYRWFTKLDLRTDAGRSCLIFQTLLRRFNRQLHYDDDTNKELSYLRKIAIANNDIPNSFSAMKRSPNFVTKSTLRFNEVLETDKPVGKVKLNNKTLPVFFRSSVVTGKSETQWKFLGRSIKPTEIDRAIKSTDALVPRTIHNRRIFNANIENNQHDLNMVRLYSFAQTCLYISPEVKDGKLPRNKYNNIEIFHKCMVPKKCTWLRLENIERILASHNATPLSLSFPVSIEYVPVVVGFSFTHGNQAIPVRDGVIVHDLDSNTAKQIWLYGKSEEGKKAYRVAYLAWGELLRILRIKKRLDTQYGDVNAE